MTEINAIASVSPRNLTDGKAISNEDAILKQVAQKFEAAFLAEMLSHTGVGQMSEDFNGGAGEAGFSGFLVQEYAAEISRTGRIGLADQVYAALKQRVQS